jgi:hypothetical protein
MVVVRRRRTRRGRASGEHGERPSAAASAAVSAAAIVRAAHRDTCLVGCCGIAYGTVLYRRIARRAERSELAMTDVPSQHRLNTCLPVSTLLVSTPIFVSQHLPLNADLRLNVNPQTLPTASLHCTAIRYDCFSRGEHLSPKTTHALAVVNCPSQTHLVHCK